MRRIAGALIVGLAVSAPAMAQPTRPGPQAALAGIDAVIEAALADQKIPGAAVAVVAGDEVVLLKGLWLPRPDKRVP